MEKGASRRRSRAAADREMDDLALGIGDLRKPNGMVQKRLRYRRFAHHSHPWRPFGSEDIIAREFDNSALARSLPRKSIFSLLWAKEWPYERRRCRHGCQGGKSTPGERNDGKAGLAPRQGILDIAAYVPGKSALADGGPVIKLSSNETPFGPSPRAVAAYLKEAQNLSRYPDGSARPLREAIAKLYGLDPARIVCGAGSDELLNLLATLISAPATRRSIPDTAFSSTASSFWRGARRPWLRRKRTTPPTSMRFSPA